MNRSHSSNGGGHKGSPRGPSYQPCTGVNWQRSSSNPPKKPQENEGNAK